MLQKSYFNFITEDYMMYIFGGLRNCDNINAPTQYLSLQALKSSGFRNFMSMRTLHPLLRIIQNEQHFHINYF